MKEYIDVDMAKDIYKRYINEEKYKRYINEEKYKEYMLYDKEILSKLCVVKDNINKHIFSMYLEDHKYNERLEEEIKRLQEKNYELCRLLLKDETFDIT